MVSKYQYRYYIENCFGKNHYLYRISIKILIYIAFLAFNSPPLASHMSSGEIGPKTIGSRVRDTTSCVFALYSVGAKSVRLRHGTTKSCYSLNATIKTPPLWEKERRQAKSLNILNTRTPMKTGLETHV